MSVKGKVKRCNKEIKRLESELDLEKIKLYENIIKFAITNQIGNLKGGMMLNSYGVDKMKDLKLHIEIKPEFHSYIIRVNYY